MWKYIYRLFRIPIEIYSNGHADVTALTDSTGTTVGTYYYDAFGNITSQTGTFNNNITYAGYQYDSEIGLYYLNSRMYDPVTARFMQEDTYTCDPNDPLSLNLYTYCQNEPLMYSDPNGHKQELSASGDIVNYDSRTGNTMVTKTGQILDHTTTSTSTSSNGTTKTVAATTTTPTTTFTVTGVVQQTSTTTTVTTTVSPSGQATQVAVKSTTTTTANGNTTTTKPVTVENDKFIVAPTVPVVQPSKSTNNVAPEGISKAGTGTGLISIAIGGIKKLGGEGLEALNEGVDVLQMNPELEAEIPPLAIPGLIKDGAKLLEDGTKAALDALKGEKVATEVIDGVGKNLLRDLGSKAEGYIAKRGWKLDTMQEVVENPYTTRDAVNKANGNAATAFYNKAGDYVVVDNVTGGLVQTSKFGDTGWIPDSTIKNPYRP